MNRIRSKLLLFFLLVAAAAALTLPGSAAAGWTWDYTPDGWTWDGAANPPGDATSAADTSPTPDAAAPAG